MEVERQTVGIVLGCCSRSYDGLKKRVCKERVRIVAMKRWLWLRTAVLRAQESVQDVLQQ